MSEFDIKYWLSCYEIFIRRIYTIGFMTKKTEFEAFIDNSEYWCKKNNKYLRLANAISHLCSQEVTN